MDEEIKDVPEVESTETTGTEPASEVGETTGTEVFTDPDTEAEETI